MAGRGFASEGAERPDSIWAGMTGSVVLMIEDLEIVAEFHPVLSWVGAPYVGDTLLRHGQGHFDLAETVKSEHLGRIRDRFYEKRYTVKGKNRQQARQFAREDSDMMISVGIERLEKILGERRAGYAKAADCSGSGVRFVVALPGFVVRMGRLLPW